MRALLLLLLCTAMAHAADDYLEVKIADPFIELHSGPGRGFPVFYVEERDQWIKIIKRKTDWFKVETKTGTQGWVHHDQLLLTLTPEGERLQISDPSGEEFLRRRTEAGVLGGDFSGAEVITLYGGYALTRNVSAEVALSQALGAVSSKQFTSLRLTHQAFPEWNISPFFAMGVGNLKSKASSTQAQAQDRSDTVAHAGIGVRGYLTRNFMLRAEYNQYVVFSSDDYNEELREWKAGLAFFY
jgi:opacity protein-like surface antigen